MRLSRKRLRDWYTLVFLRLLADDEAVRLDLSDQPEFEEWRWVDYWLPLKEIVFFKRRVYERALKELEPLLFPDKSERPKRHRSLGYIQRSRK